METFDPASLPLSKVHNLIQCSVAPRPIALAATVDHEGLVNLSPFSFFNVFSIQPPILIFSPSRRGRDNTTKHTYENVLEVPEVTISIVDFNMVHQASLTSVEYPKGTNEFLKSGLTPVSAQRIRPPYVGESPVAFECAVKQVVPLGDAGGAGNLVICEVLLIHVRDGLADERGNILPDRLDGVARMGNDFYVRASGAAIFGVPKPNARLGIGFDKIPPHIRGSRILSGNDLGQLGNIEALPDENSLLAFRRNPEYQDVLKLDADGRHAYAKKLLREGRLEDAWKVLLSV